MLVINSLGIGGAEAQLLWLAGELKRRGDDVSIVTLLHNPPEKTIGALPPDVQHYCLHVRRGRPPLRAFLRFMGLVATIGPDVICSFLFHANLLTRASRLFHSTPVVNSVRNEYFGRRWRSHAMRYTNWLSNVTVFNSAVAAAAGTAGGVTVGTRVRVIPNALRSDPEPCDPKMTRELRRNLGIGDGHFLWLAVGRLEPQKDYWTLLKAASLLDGSDWRIAICGTGRLEAELRDATANLDLERRVVFLGMRRDIGELLCASDGFVMSSNWEGMPNALMEALVMGRAAVATDVGGTRELIGESDQIVPPGDPTQLAGAMKMLMKMPGQERRLAGEVGRSRVRRICDPDQVSTLWRSLLTDLAESHK